MTYEQDLNQYELSVRTLEHAEYKRGKSRVMNLKQTL